MSYTVIIEHVDHVYMKIDAEKFILKEISEFFTFRVPNCHFHPAYKKRLWNGNIYLFNTHTNTLYCGLLEHLVKFLEFKKYDVVIDKRIQEKNNITDEELENYLKSLKITAMSTSIDHHDYQIAAIKQMLNETRCLTTAPTGSGKSLIIYSVIRKILDLIDKKKILLIVPTKSLVLQMYNDFVDYSTKNGWSAKDNIHLIYEGKDKESDRSIYISTWQSLYKLPQKYFDKFNCVIVDEAHLANAESLKNILTKLVNCKYRFGTTATIKETKCHKLVLEGLLGPIFKTVTTEQLIKRDILAELNIDCIVLKHNDIDSKNNKDLKYQEELDYLVSHNERNLFIRDLALNTKGNTLLLFQYVEKHGKVLYEMIKKKTGVDRQVFFIYGDTEAELREQMRGLVEKSNDAIIVGSLGVLSTGINIRNLKNIIFASPSKSRIRVLQSIGRQLRKAKNKECAKLYDIADDMTHKSHINYTMKHYMERIKIYNEEKFPYKIINIALK